MRVLVTGHRGFIGQNLIKYIHKHTDWEVDGWEWGDSVYPTVGGYNWVMHLGAISSTTEQDVDKVIKQNLEFSQWLFNACKINHVNLQYSSSASVYGLVSDFKETSPASPQTPYAWSKYLFDHWVAKQESAYGCAVQGFRYFNVYGNLEEHKQDQASPVTKFRQQSASGTIKLFKDSDKYLRDFVAVEDVCRTHLKFVEVKESGLWNIGTGKPVSFEHVAKLIAKKTNAQIEYIEMPDILKKGYQAYTCADLTKLTAAIGPQQWISVEDWLNS
jgi:ADP-L-glycero-D-manno-heptose 6-epimerase